MTKLVKAIPASDLRSVPTQAARIPVEVLDAARAVMRHHAARHDALHAATLAVSLPVPLVARLPEKPEPGQPD